jgi:hypothetical protein
MLSHFRQDICLTLQAIDVDATHRNMRHKVNAHCMIVFLLTRPSHLAKRYPCAIEGAILRAYVKGDQRHYRMNRAMDRA